MLKTVSFRYINEYFNYLTTLTFQTSVIRTMLLENSKFYVNAFTTLDNFKTYYDINFKVLDANETSGIYYLTSYISDISMYDSTFQFNVMDLTDNVRIFSTYNYDSYKDYSIQENLVKYKKVLSDSVTRYLTYYNGLLSIYNGESGLEHDIDYYDKLIKNNGYKIYA